MATAKNEKPEAGSEQQADLHRPGEDIERPPRLKVKPVGSRSEAEVPGPTVRGGTLFGDQEAEGPPAADAPEQRPPKKVVHVRREQGEVRHPYATYRSAPPDEAAEKRELAAIAGSKPPREVSTGFVLGIALIVVALLSGIFIVRLSKKVGALEARITRLESAGTKSVIAQRRLP